MRFAATVIVLAMASYSVPSGALTLVGDTVDYEVVSASAGVFGAGSATVGDGIEFVVDAAADAGFSDGKISVDVSGSTITFRGPTTPNTFRYGYETIRVYSLDFGSDVDIESIATTINVADPLALTVTFGPREIQLHLGNSLWIPDVGDTVRIDLVPSPVPEPAPYLLLLSGLAATVTLALRRGGKQRSPLGQPR